MGVDLMICYKDPAREPFYHPFSTYWVLTKSWYPLAQKLDLETLQRLECLAITDRQEAHHLLDELRAVQQHLQQPGQADVAPTDAQNMLRRISEVMPTIEQAIAEWDQVKEPGLPRSYSLA